MSKCLALLYSTGNLYCAISYLQGTADCAWAMIGSGAPPAARSLTHPFADLEQVNSRKNKRKQEKKRHNWREG